MATFAYRFDAEDSRAGILGHTTPFQKSQPLGI